MMKALRVTLLLALCLAMTAPTFALAAGKATITHETVYVESDNDKYVTIGEKARALSGGVLVFENAYLFAEITNTGDKAIVFNDGLFELFNADGDSVESSSYLSCYPQYLAPGESGYIYDYLYIDDPSLENSIDDYSLTVTGKGDNKNSTLRLPAEGIYEEVESGYWTNRYVTATIENNTANTLWNVKVVYVVFDQNDKLIFAKEDTMYDTGVPVGQKVMARIDVESALSDVWQAEESTPTKIIVIAYTELEAEA